MSKKERGGDNRQSRHIKRRQRDIAKQAARRSKDRLKKKRRARYAVGPPNGAARTVLHHNCIFILSRHGVLFFKLDTQTVWISEIMCIIVAIDNYKQILYPLGSFM